VRNYVWGFFSVQAWAALRALGEVLFFKART